MFLEWNLQYFLVNKKAEILKKNATPSSMLEMFTANQ